MGKQETFKEGRVEFVKYSGGYKVYMKDILDNIISRSGTIKFYPRSQEYRYTRFFCNGMTSEELLTIALFIDDLNKEL